MCAKCRKHRNDCPKKAFVAPTAYVNGRTTVVSQTFDPDLARRAPSDLIHKMNATDRHQSLPWRMGRAPVKYTIATLIVAVSILTGGCTVAYWVGMPFVYDGVHPKGHTQYLDERYFDGPTPGDAKNRMDLFFPPGEGWPIAVFVHGGGWNAGDKGQRVGGKDFYRNVGRHYVEHGVGAAVINYRLIPGVHWRTQLRDVAYAIRHARQRAGEEGGDTTRLFLVGYSAGAHLVARAALDDAILADADLSPDVVCGVVAVSGAGYDMEDRETYQLGAEFDYLADRFGAVDGTGTWPHEASVLQYVTPEAPPFLVMYGGQEFPFLERQSELLIARLKSVGASVDTIVEPDLDHARMALALSKERRVAGSAPITFFQDTTCDGLAGAEKKAQRVLEGEPGVPTTRPN